MFFFIFFSFFHDSIFKLRRYLEFQTETLPTIKLLIGKVLGQNQYIFKLSRALNPFRI